MSDPLKKLFEHIIRERYCKGCNICVHFCPKQVLSLKGGKVFVERPELCVGCTMCELRCPDFAIEVYERGAAAEISLADEETDYNLPPEAMHD